MDYTTVESTREFVARMDHGVDWREQIDAELVRERDETTDLDLWEL